MIDGQLMRKYKIAALTAIPVLGLSLGLTANAAPMGPPLVQTGAVHSCTTGGQAAVTTTDGGQDWYFNGGPGTVKMQYGVVHSFTTGGNANVLTFYYGTVWQFDGNGTGLFCSPPR